MIIAELKEKMKSSAATELAVTAQAVGH